MSLNVQTSLWSNDCPISTTPDKFGPLRRSDNVLDDLSALRGRMGEDGYLFLPGFFSRDLVMRARRSVTDILASEGVLDPSRPAMDAIAKPDVEMYFRADLAKGNPDVEQLIYGPRILSFFERFLGGEVRHFDYTWLRAVAHGLGTCPHCDIVYMGRGTTHLYTAWTPLADIPLELGGLIVLEGSHQHAQLRNTYGRMDVDAMCSNKQGKNVLSAHGYDESGAITMEPHKLRDDLGGRWLTAEYQMGDVVIFGMYTIHGSLDNETEEIRLSTDSRYQLASEPVDERWVGQEQIGHGPEGKRNLIC